MAHLITEFFNFIGRAVQVHTLVDYYNYVKAVEYLICIGFFAAFPIFYRSVIKYDGDSGKKGQAGQADGPHRQGGTKG